MSRARPLAGSDVGAGLLTLALGAAVLWHVRGFPELEDGSPGPALFPGIIAALLVVFGTVLMLRSVLRRRGAGQATDVGENGYIGEGAGDAGPDRTDSDDITPTVASQVPASGDDAATPGAPQASTTTEPPDASDSDAAPAQTSTATERVRPRALINAGAVLLAIVIYILLSGSLGFVLTLAPLLAVLMVLLGARVVVALAATVAATAAVTLIFQFVLRVPLPIGPLGF